MIKKMKVLGCHEIELIILPTVEKGDQKDLEGIICHGLGSRSHYQAGNCIFHLLLLPAWGSRDAWEKVHCNSFNFHCIYSLLCALMCFNLSNSSGRHINLLTPFYWWGNWGQRGLLQVAQPGKKAARMWTQVGQWTAGLLDPLSFLPFWKFGKICLTSWLLFSNLFILCSGLGEHNCDGCYLLLSAGPWIQMPQILSQRLCKPHPMRASWADILSLQSSCSG